MESSKFATTIKTSVLQKYVQSTKFATTIALPIYEYEKT